MSGLFGLFGGSKPKTYNPTQIINAETTANTNAANYTAQLNRVNQYNPYGSLTYTNDGNGNWTQSESLNPYAQDQLTDQQGIGASLADYGASNLLPQVQDSLSQPFSYDGLAPAPTADTDWQNQVTDGYYNQETSRLDPQFNQQEDQMNSDLAAQGITQGSQAWQNAQGNFNRDKNDAYTSAENSAITNGTNAMTSLFGLQSQAHQTAVNDYTTQRYAPIQELGQLEGNAVTSPSFSGYNTSTDQAADVAGAYQIAQQGNMAAYQAQQANNSSMLSGLFGLGKAALPFMIP